MAWTMNEYAPALPKLAVATAPLVVNRGVGAPLGAATVDHVKVGEVDNAYPNWSSPCATIVWLVPETDSVSLGPRTLPLGVAMLTLVSVGVTMTVLALLTDRPPASTILAVKLYVPALVNVAVAYFAALVPLMLKGAVPPRV